MFYPICSRITIKKQWKIMGFIFFLFSLSGCMDLASNGKHIAEDPNVVYRPGEVYTMRGVGGIFSRGMNRLENTLRREYHIRTSSTIWYRDKELADYIIEHYRSGELKGPIILIGHSLGGNEQIKAAWYLERAHIPVRLLITIDAVSPIRVPPNVEEVLNIYKPGIVPMFSGQVLYAYSPEKTKIENFRVNNFYDIYVNHFTIDKHPKVQKLMLDKVLATLAEKK